MDFSTLDELATWMLTNIRLSRYDDQFINNLTLYITKNKRITSNQTNLFKKVATKYSRQFKQHKIDILIHLNKSWSVNIVESTSEYTGASIKIENNKIIFRSPFNRNFLTALKKNSIYGLQWVRDKKFYEAEYSPNILKDLIHLSSDYYEVINYCEITKSIIDDMSKYEDIKYWAPTLINANGRYYIAACNEYLHEAIKTIEFKNDLNFFSDLVSYGVSIDSNIVNKFYETETKEKVDVAINFITDFEINQVDQLIDWLIEFGCDAICEPKTYIVGAFSNKIIDKLENKKIQLIKKLKDCNNYKKPVVVYMRSSASLIDDDKPTKLYKLIKLVNSELINIK